MHIVFFLYFLSDSKSPVTVSSSGDVRLTRRISESHNFEVIVTDQGNPPLSSRETISLVPSDSGNIQEASSVSATTKFLKVSADAKIGTKVGSVDAAGGQARHYEIVSSPSISKVFTVDSLTGDVYTSSDLSSYKSTTLELEVRAASVNGQSPPKMARVKVEVSTGGSDESSGQPIFTTDPITLSAKESSPVGAAVADLRRHTLLRSDRFDVLEQHPDGYLRLSDGGQLTVAKPLDFETHKEHLLIVRGISTESRLTSDVTVIVSVADINDNTPKIVLPSKEVTFPSSSPILPTPLMSLLVQDQDAGEAGRAMLKIRAGNDDGTFTLDQDNFHLGLSKPPTLGRYNLVLRATDHGFPQLFSEEELIVRFENAGGSSALRQAVYRASTQENAPPGSRVITIGLADGVSSRQVRFRLLKGNDLFDINESTGEIVTTASLDREEEEQHSLVVGLTSTVGDYARATDTAVVYVAVDDVNDNAPAFDGQTCKDLRVRENSRDSYVHAFVAQDPDLGENGRISYSLVSSDDNVTRLFRIERDTGKLHALPLDREEEEVYSLEVVAMDHGPERLTTKCTISLTVLDENDNEPSFTQSIYSASVREDIAIGTEVVKVLATDPDEGDNARVRYSLENATDWAFAIDERTGSVYTIKTLDRESTSEINFEVVATDGGSESFRSSQTRVKIIVTDANDHVPEFASFPFRVNMTATPSTGVSLLRLSAHDPDSGPNGHLTYNIVRPEQRERFHLSPEEGLLTLASEEINWEPGTVERIEVAVSDAGSPPKSSTGLVEILIEGGPPVSLKFQKDNYPATLMENPLSGSDIIEVRAVRSDGRRQRVIYSFLSGNDFGALEINSNNGLIRVRDASLVDFESQQTFNLTISARALGDDTLVAYATCSIQLRDVNDHAPKFTREMYHVKVLEGNSKGSKVAQTKAIDRDATQSEEVIRYEIIDGNVDGAFIMDPSNPGTILTNTVLDREIRDLYELTVSATDSGSPSLVGLTQVIVTVVDINDNKPHFAPVSPIRIPRDARKGTAVSTFRANDVDLAPGVAYRLKYPNNYLTVDVVTGQLILLKNPKGKTGTSKITVIASDTKFETALDAEVSFDADPRKCSRVLSKPLFNLLLSYEEKYPAVAGNVDLTSCAGLKFEEGQVEFEVARQDQGMFSVQPNGSVVVAREFEGQQTSFVVTAVDTRTKQRNNAVVAVAKTKGNIKTLEVVGEAEYIDLTNAKLGAPVAKLKTNQESSSGLYFSISSNPVLSIDSSSGLVYAKKGYRTQKAGVEEVTVTVKRLYDMQSASKSFKITGVSTEEAVSFDEDKVVVPVSESTPIGTQVRICSFNKRDGGRNPVIMIASGNEGNVFSFDPESLRLTLSKRLSHRKKHQHHVVLKMTSVDHFSLCKVEVNVEKETGVTLEAQHSVFPLHTFASFVSENEPPGTSLPGPPIVKLPGVTFWTTSDTFKVDQRTGEISTAFALDYELTTSHSFTMYSNASGVVSECFVEVLVGSRDEFAPSFGQASYYFALPAPYEVGSRVGRVMADDRDAGPDGVVNIAMAVRNDYFAIDRQTGQIVVAKRLDTGVFNGKDNGLKRKKRDLREVTLVVKARSRQPDSLESSALVTIALDEAIIPVASKAGTVAGWVQGMLVGIILLVIILVIAAIFVCKRRQRQEEARKNNLLATGGIVNPTLSMEMTSSGDALSRFPPQYSEIVSDYEKTKGGKAAHLSMGHLRSELSEKSHRSASSGRGSVEDGEEEADVEIRMINEGNYFSPDSTALSGFGPDEADRASDEGSVQNTEEYLARLGIDVRKPPNLASTGGGGTELSQGGGYENAYGDSSIYNRIPDDTLSEKNSVLSGSKTRGAGGSLLYGSHHHPAAAARGPPSVAGSLTSSAVHSEQDELASSYNWDYLLDWGPQYQPLAHVFKEISKLKDDASGAGGGGGAAGLSVASSTDGHGAASSPMRKLPHTSHLFRSVGRSPISHDAVGGGSSSVGGSGPLSPSFHPALSPLATKSPSVSPLSVPVQNRPGKRLEL